MELSTTKVLAASVGIVSLASFGAVAFAQNGSTSGATGASSSGKTRTLPAPTQACMQAMVSLESARLAHFDEMTAKHKQERQTRLDALKTIAAISDDAQRQEAMKKMHDDMRATKGEPEDLPSDVQAAMDAVKTACGDRGMFMMHGASEMGDGMTMRKGHGRGARFFQGNTHNR